MRRWFVGVVLAVLSLVLPGSPARAADGDVVDAARHVVGGCVVSFDASGSPRLTPSTARPCVGARSVGRTSLGDVSVNLSWSADDPQTRLLVSGSTTLAARGITVGATRSKGAITLRYYDDRTGRRVDLRTAAGRARIAGGATTVGWLGVAPQSTAGLDLGLDAYGRFHDRLATDATTVAGGCVIRLATTGPWIHANAAHHCTGVRSVGLTPGGKLRLTYSDEQVGSVVNVSADPDETLTSRGILAGTSTTTRTLDVQLYDSSGSRGRALNLTRAADRRRVAGTYANLWVSWTKTTARPGAVNASYSVAPDKYGAWVNGSAAQGAIQQAGCEIRFSALNGQPAAYTSPTSRCTGVRSVGVADNGLLLVEASPGAHRPVISTSVVSSRSLTDYGIRSGPSGGGSLTYYRLYSVRLDRPLDLRSRADRVLLQRTGSALYVGWSRPW